MLFSPISIIFTTKPGGIQWSIPLYSLFLSCSLKFKSNFFVFINFFPTRPWCHLFAIISRGTSPLITCRGLFSFQVYLSKRFAIWRRFTVWFCGLPMGEWETEKEFAKYFAPEIPPGRAFFSGGLNIFVSKVRRSQESMHSLEGRACAAQYYPVDIQYTRAHMSCSLCISGWSHCAKLEKKL